MGSCFGRLLAVSEGDDGGDVNQTSTSDRRSRSSGGHRSHHRSSRDATNQGLSDGDDDVPLLSGHGQDDPSALLGDRQRRHRHHRRSQHRHARSGHSSSGDASGGHLQYFPSPNGPSTSSLDSNADIRLAQRVGLIQQLPLIRYDEGRKQIARECVICMVEFDTGDMLRCLPCLHIYHEHCIDQWLLKSLTCPSCLEPVDAALLATFATGWSS